MKNSIQIAVMLLSIFLIGCSKESTQTNPEPVIVSNTEIATVIESDSIENQRDIVFIAGYDKNGSTYYTKAKNFFETHDVEIVESAFSLQEIVLWLNVNYNNMPYTNVHIVNKNRLNKMSLETTIKGDKVTSLSLNQAIQQNTLPMLNDDVFVPSTKIIFHSYGLAKNTELMNTIKQVFSSTNTPEIVASEYISVFDSEYAPQYLAKPYYAFYPTAQSPGRVDLAKQFERNYPDANINWLSVMNNSKERFLGDVYSYKFNVPVCWDIDFHGDEEMPSFNSDEELMTWMRAHETIAAELNDIGIPLEKYRWYQTSVGDTLIIKGKVTVICVLEPLMNFAYPTEYMVPNVENQRLYDVL